MHRIPADPSTLSPISLKRTLGRFGMKGGSKTYMIKALLDLRVSLTLLSTRQPEPAAAAPMVGGEMDLVPDPMSSAVRSSPHVPVQRGKQKRDKVTLLSPIAAGLDQLCSRDDVLSRIRGDAYLYQRMLLMHTVELGEVHDALQLTRPDACGGAFACTKRLLQDVLVEQGVSTQIAWRQ